jgi:hypothetical protein
MGASPIPLHVLLLGYGLKSLNMDLSGPMQVEAWQSSPMMNESVSKCAGIGLWHGPLVAGNGQLMLKNCSR